MHAWIYHEKLKNIWIGENEQRFSVVESWFVQSFYDVGFIHVQQKVKVNKWIGFDM